MQNRNKYGNEKTYQHGSFMNVIMEKEIMVPVLVRGKGIQSGNGNGNAKNERENLKEKTEHRYSVWGPTCDAMDCVAKEATFGSEVRIGDWLKYSGMGGMCSFFPRRCHSGLLVLTTSSIH